MDEMNKMNEVTTEETSMEMTPVETNNEVNNAEEKNSGIDSWVGVGVAVAALAIGGIVAGVKKHKANKKTDAESEGEKKPKAKKHFKLQSPVKIVEDKTEEVQDVEYHDVVDETEED